MPNPIFVIGRDRSGTKWLSNIIASHRDVASVQHEEHSGILEATDILVAAPILFGDMRVAENYIAFLECFSQTDFFRLTGLDKQLFYEFGPTDYHNLFKLMMDRFTENEGKSRWVQKSDVISMNDLYEQFPDASFIIISRELKDNIRSIVGQRIRDLGHDYQKHIIKGTIRYAIDMAQIKKYLGRSNVYSVQYEDLRRDRGTVLKNICDFLKLEFDENMLRDKFRKNTSFKNGVSRDDVLTQYDVFKIDMASLVLNAFPAWVYDLLYTKRKQKTKREHLVPHEKKFISYKFRKKELGWK